MVSSGLSQDQRADSPSEDSSDREVRMDCRLGIKSFGASASLRARHESAIASKSVFFVVKTVDVVAGGIPVEIAYA